MPKVPRIKLASGHHMPLVGFGIWKVPQERTADAVYNAIKIGYRHIDGAYDYRNSTEAGQGVQRAIREGLVKREDMFITSKLWNNYHKREHAIEMAKVETESWGLDYLDLYLIHFPVAQEYIPPSKIRWPCWWSDEGQTRVTPRAKVPVSETWAALESLVERPANGAGFLRSIGISNFHTQLVYDLLTYARIPPSVLQIEHHPYLTQPQLVRMGQENGIAVTAYSTFGPQSFLELGNPRAKTVRPLLEHPVVRRIAETRGRTPGQVLLRWCTQRDIIVIPKSNNPERLAQNLDCCSFDLTSAELEEISGLDLGLRFNDPGVGLSTPLRIFT